MNERFHRKEIKRKLRKKEERIKSLKKEKY